MTNATEHELSIQNSYPVSPDWLSNLRKVKEDGESEINKTEHALAGLRDMVHRDIALAQEKHQADVEKLKEQLAATIIKHKSKLYALQSHLEMIQARVAAATSLISPVHSLPNEILLLIFTYVCSGKISKAWMGPVDVQIELSYHRILVPPFMLAMVCRRWHSLVYGCAPLWTRFAFPRRDVYSLKPEEVIYSQDAVSKATKQLLILSSLQPTFVTLDLDLELGPSELPLYRDVLSLSNNWRECKFDCSGDWLDLRDDGNWDMLSEMFGSLRGNLKNLESLTVGCPIMQFTALGDTPKLRSLNVTSDSGLSFTSMCPADIPISWPQITSYSVSNNHLYDILLCLESTTNLTTLVIDSAT